VHSEHVVDRDHARPFEPGLRRLVWFRYERAHAPVLGHVSAQNCCRDVAVEHHLRQLFGAFGRALGIGGISVLGQVRIVECHPGHAIEIDIVLVFEHAAGPKPRGLCIGTHPHPAAFNIFGLQLSVPGVVSDAVVLEPAGDRRWKQYVRFAVCFCLQESDDRELAGIKLVVANHPLEPIVGDRRPAEIEPDDGRAGLALLEGHCDRISLRAIVTG
jgi:hypothetical protein